LVPWAGLVRLDPALVDALVDVALGGEEAI
jgi:hypothetical protein